MPTRSSDVMEVYGERALMAGVGGIIALLLGIVLWIFRGDGILVGLSLVLIVGGLGALGYAAYNILEARKVTSVAVECPYCQFKNKLTATPDKDFTCQGCNRLIPIQDGHPMSVSQVRCGFCNALNYYSPKTEVLLCEDCNREVPISLDEGRVAKKSAFARVDDDRLYELVLVSNNGHKTEELISALQHMLALNRNQVKQLLDELPVTLLTGIPRMKAESLTHQLQANDGVAEFRALN